MGQRNLEGRMSSEFCLKKELFEPNTWSNRGKEEGDIHNETK